MCGDRVRVAARPSKSTRPPHPVSTSQAGRLAGTKAGEKSPCRFAFRIEPVTATPSAWPICRLADAMPDASPAWLDGIAATAAVLIWPSIMPMPTPSSRKAVTR